MPHFSRIAGALLDSAAGALHKVAGRAGAKVANTVIYPIRISFDHGCARCDAGTCNRT
jgi:hypothetical protein